MSLKQHNWDQFSLNFHVIKSDSNPSIQEAYFSFTPKFMVSDHRDEMELLRAQAAAWGWK